MTTFFFTSGNASTYGETISYNTVTAAELLGFTVRVVPPPDPPLPSAFVDAVYQAVSWLELDVPVRVEEVHRARKALSKIHHPDVGGDIEVMKQINAAADFLLELA